MIQLGNRLGQVLRHSGIGGGFMHGDPFVESIPNNVVIERCVSLM